MEMLTKLSDAIFLTFYIRDGKAARDAGDEPGMEAQIAKVQAAVESGRISEEVGQQAVDKILYAPYRPNPAKAASGCVVPGARVREAQMLKSDPLAKAKAQIESAVKSGAITQEQADPMLAQIAEKVEERKRLHQESILTSLQAMVNNA